MNFLTNSDRWNLSLMFFIAIIFTAYIITTYIVAGTIFGMVVVFCMISLFTNSPFLRYSRTFKDLGWPEYVWYYFGWLSGATYWAFYRSNTGYVMFWSGWYILSSVAMIIYGLLRNMKKTYVYIIAINILVTMIYICVLLFFTVSLISAGFVTIILFLLSVGAVPVAYNSI